MSTTFSLANEIADRHKGYIEEADELLREISQADRRPTFAETTFFNRECGWNERAMNDQLRRMNQVLRYKAIAGSSADREALALEAKTAAEIAAKEVPKHRAKAEEHTSKADAFEKDARLAQKRFDESNEGALQLRELVPEHIAGEVRSEVARIESTIGQEMRDAEIRLNELQACLSPEKYRDESYYLESLQRSFRNAVTVITEGKILRRILSPEWPAIKAGIQSELAELKPRIETLKAQRAEMIEQAELPLNYYAG